MWKWPLVCLALLAPGIAQGQQRGVSAHEDDAHRDLPVSSVITRKRALQLGMQRGPEIAVANAPRAAVAEVRRLANPLLVQPASAALYGGYRWGRLGAGLELTANVVQSFSWQPLGAARERGADSLHTLTQASIEQARLQAGERALLAWVDLLEADALHELRARTRTDAEQLQKIVRTRVGVGTGEPVDAALADGERGAAEAAELEAEGLLTEARVGLRYALGMAPEGPIDADGDLFSIPALAGTGEGALGARSGHPNVTRAESEAALARDEARIARANASPSYGVGATYQREGTADQVVMGGLILPLPFGDFGGYARARQEVDAQRLHEQIGRVKGELARDRAIASHEREHTRATYEALVRGARAPFTEALRIATLRYEKGTGDLATVLLARQRATAAEERVVMAAAAVQRADIRHASRSGGLLEEAR